MKTSNKLLIAGFAIVVLLVTALHLTLYANYKNGNYTPYYGREATGPDEVRSFPSVKHVSISNLADATISFGDVAQVKKADEKNIQVTQRGDTLVITNDPGHRAAATTLTIPRDATLHIANTHLFIQPGRNPGDNNPVIYLQKSQADFSGEKIPLVFGHVKLAASDNSLVLFQGDTQIDDLFIQLSNSSIEHREGRLGQLSIVTDSLSRIALQAKHLLNAKITTGTQE